MTGVADFTGYATRNDVVCTDGRTILAGAFAHQDGEEVPLVWMHGHDDVTNVLGKVVLRHVADGVKAEAYFNATDRAQHAKEMVQHGDVKWLSIFANGLRERSKQVAHGIIREVSLVLGGANPGATIDNLSIVHSDGEMDLYDEAEITTGLEIEVPEDSLAHADKTATATAEADTSDDDRTLEDVLNTLNEEQTTAVNFLLSQALTVEGDDITHSAVEDDADDTDGDDEDETESDESTDADETEESEDAEDGDEDETDSDAEEGSEDSESDESDDTTDDEGSADVDSDTSTDTEAGDESVQHDNINQEDNSMTHNVFDQSKQDGSATGQTKRLSKDEVHSIMHSMKKTGSLKESLIGYVADKGLEHGIENIDFLFPDPKLLTTEPSWVSRRIEWVEKVMNGVKRTPFARIRTIHADITADEARARGYVKGNLKVEEMFTLLKRDTTPQTIYKKQKLDRDDVLDITDLDVVAYVKAEMDLMLREEIAGAILVGDGRSNGDDDKIKEDKVRPILTDSELYTLTYNVNLDDASSSIDELIDSILEAREEWKGTGTPTFFCSPSVAAKFRTVKDGFGHRLYKNLKEVAEAIDAMEVVSVEIFNRFPNLVGILVNLSDYSIGTDRGGQATMFDDFDLDYNKYRYLLETRLSGALTVPHSAQVFMKVAGSNATLPDPQAPAFAANVVTVPTVANVTYKNKDTTATLVTGTPITLSAGQKLNVIAVAGAGKNFASNSRDEWTYKGEA